MTKKLSGSRPKSSENVCDINIRVFLEFREFGGSSTPEATWMLEQYFESNMKWCNPDVPLEATALQGRNLNRKSQFLQILVLVAFAAFGFAVSRWYVATSIRERLPLTNMSGSVSVDWGNGHSYKNIITWMSDDWNFYVLRGAVNCSLVWLTFGVLLARMINSHRGSRGIMCQPGTAATLACLGTVIYRIIGFAS